MKKFQSLMYRILPTVSALALAFAYAPIGKHCRIWLYQPVMPAKLRDR